jgi:hypothetical protein
MNEWEVLRVAVVVASWLAVVGGLVMAVMWTVFGGPRAAGPEDESMAVAGVHPDRPVSRQTSFSAAGLGMHGLLGILTASVVTYAAVQHDPEGYAFVLLAVVVTAVPGTVMYLRWKQGRRPRVRGAEHRKRVEDRLPKAVVYGHGAMVAVTVGLSIVLLVVA